MHVDCTYCTAGLEIPNKQYSKNLRQSDGRNFCGSSCCVKWHNAKRLANFENRFWKDVDVCGEDECWVWLGSRNVRSDYGQVKRNRKTERTHRLAFEFTFKRPPGDLLRHTCDNPPCCNPYHLLEGTPNQNVQDCFDRGRFCLGEKRPTSKLNESQVRKIIIDLIAGRSMASLGREYGVHAGTIQMIKMRRNWNRIWKQIELGA